MSLPVIKPMLSTLIKEPFNDPEYVFEIKWDGYRILAYVEDDEVRLASRGGMDYTQKYPPVTNALKKLKRRIVVDGEVVFLNAEGKPDFDALQRFNGQRSGPIVYYVFDILFLDEKRLTDLPLIERKAILKTVIGDAGPIIRYSEDFDDGIQLYQQAKLNGLEGIMAKHRRSKYIPDDRSKKWLKIPIEQKEEFVVGGWIESETRKFRTLLFGAYEQGKLKWIGHAGGGYKDKEMASILDKLKHLEIQHSPFSNAVEYEGKVHWVRPDLVANIKYATFTRAGKIRKPAIFLGFRDDKLPKQVMREHNRRLKPAAKNHNPSDIESNWSAVEAEVITSKDTLNVEGFDVEIYNVDRTLWRGITKAHLLQYYHQVADYILPHLRNRPLSLYLKLKNAFRSGLYIKDMEDRHPVFADIFTTERKHKKNGRADVINYIVCNNKATLLYLINLGCIDVNPWTSSVLDTAHPDYVVIDLDPSDGDFKKVIETARAAKEFFQEHRLDAFPKTSGKTGMHIYVPCRGFTFEKSRQLAEIISSEIQRLVPSITTLDIDITLRGNKLFIDASQNDYTDTLAAPYSVRPYHVPLVSTPLEWKEINHTLDRGNFNMKTIIERLEKNGDLFLPVLNTDIAFRNSEILRTFL